MVHLIWRPLFGICEHTKKMQKKKITRLWAEKKKTTLKKGKGLNVIDRTCFFYLSHFQMRRRNYFYSFYIVMGGSNSLFTGMEPLIEGNNLFWFIEYVVVFFKSVFLYCCWYSQGTACIDHSMLTLMYRYELYKNTFHIRPHTQQAPPQTSSSQPSIMEYKRKKNQSLPLKEVLLIAFM